VEVEVENIASSTRNGCPINDAWDAAIFFATTMA